MKFLLAAVNAKYIHSNLGVYSLKKYADEKRKGQAADVSGADWEIEIGEYTINHQMDDILQDIYEKDPDAVGFSCYIWNILYVQELIRDLKKVLRAEAIVYGRLPLMITENCLVQNETGCRLDRQGPCVPEDGPCRCGQPNVLVDRTGAAFPLLPAYGHRTEIQNSKPLYLADRPEHRRLGLAYARLRFTTETAEECVSVVQNYLDAAPAAGDFTRGLYERGVE